jgi:hypothetical protein
VDEEEKLKKALLKKAMGYSAKEETVEFIRDDLGEEVVAKRKVSRKHYPPDISALRLLIEHFYSNNFEDISSMTDEELQRERKRIIELLKEEERNALKNE